MLLAIEVGNSNTLFGLSSDDDDRLLARWRLATERDRMPDEWFAMLTTLFAAEGRALAEVTGVILSSVVPSVTTWLVAMARERLQIEPTIVTADLPLGLRILTDDPREVGADRLVDSVAAFARYGGPAIIIDLGTATTFEVISKEGDYLGGAIAAGMVTSLSALSRNTAQLFSVALTLPDRVIGKNTIDHLRTGIVLGHVAMLEGMIDRIWHELDADGPVILTGGLAPLIAAASPRFTHHDPDLTLNGLSLIQRRLLPST